MATLEITIKPHHLKGNSWTHQENPEKRHCPLQEALLEAKYPLRNVGGSFVSFLIPVEGEEFYDIDDKNWDEAIVNRLIKEANEGSEKEYIVTLIN